MTLTVTSLAERVEALDRIAALKRMLRSCGADAVTTGRLAGLEGAETPIDNEAITTIKGAAFVTGYSETTIRKRIKNGRIEARHVGGRVLVRTASLTVRK